MRIPSYVLTSPLLFTSTTALTIAGRPANPEFAPLLLAQDYYDGDVTIVDGGVANWTGGADIDLAGNAETQALRYFSSLPDLRIIYNAAEVYYRIAANKHANISKPQDLKGKRIGAMEDTSAEYFVRKYMASLGLGASDYEAVGGFFCNSLPCEAEDALPTKLANGDVDAVGMWEPTLQLSIDALGEQNTVVFTQEDVYREIFLVYSTKQKLEDPKSRAEIKKYLKALRKVSKELEDADLDIAVARVATVMDGAVEHILRKTWGDMRMRGTLPLDLLDVLQEEEVWSAEVGRRDVVPREELAVMIDRSVLDEILAEEAADGS